MTNNNQKTRQALKDLDIVGRRVKSIIDEVRVQAHLGAKELEDNAGPYLAEVRAVSKAAAHDLARRGRELRHQLKQLRAQHRAAR
jgi:hypothetical protein